MAFYLKTWRSFVPQTTIEKYEANLGRFPRGLEPTAPWSAFHFGDFGIAIHPGGTICIRTRNFTFNLLTIDPDGIARHNGCEIERDVLAGRCDLHKQIEAVQAWVLRAEGRCLPQSIPKLLIRIAEARAEVEREEAGLTEEELKSKRLEKAIDRASKGRWSAEQAQMPPLPLNWQNWDGLDRTRDNAGPCGRPETGPGSRREIDWPMPVP